jgi:hypothetical protein
MKLKFRLINLVPQRLASRVVQQFGQARLIRRPNGEHELIGGTRADRTAAFEWVSLFAHEIVFTHFHRESKPKARPVALRSLTGKWWPISV